MKHELKEGAKAGRCGGNALDRLKLRFEDWRRSRSGRERIPAELLQAAKRLVGRHRPSPLAKALRLHYRQLVNPSSVSVERGWNIRGRGGIGEDVSRANGPRFVKVSLEAPRPSPVMGMEGPGLVELENPRGLKARVYFGRAPLGLVGELIGAMEGGNR